jgi:C4-dicarboxylate-specific signal transduction histidine kinase
MIVRKLVTNNLEDIFKYLENFDFAQTSSPQRFNYRNKPNSNYKDELDQLNEKINHFIDLLTEHNRASQQKLTEAQKKIEIQKMNAINSARLAALGEMAGGIAHEINNPLTIVSSSVNYLRRLYDGDKLSDDTFNKITTDIEQTLERITKIIKGLKNVSRDPNDFEPVEVSINEILAEVLGLCTERFKNHGINLLLDISPELEKEVIVCDRVQISQALINLLGNAFDALENCPAPWVKVQFEKDGTNSIIRISDNGDGISDEDIHKVFAPFYTSKAVGKGTGLGLSISKTILERHGGELRLDTNSEFTSFILTIPEINISDYEFNPFISPMRESELAPLS